MLYIINSFLHVIHITSSILLMMAIIDVMYLSDIPHFLYYKQVWHNWLQYPHNYLNMYKCCAIILRKCIHSQLSSILIIKHMGNNCQVCLLEWLFCTKLTYITPKQPHPNITISIMLKINTMSEIFCYL